ncbi:hypothetical protein MPER_04023, partial [Moniliophthora perniciosa FA553]
MEEAEKVLCLKETAEPFGLVTKINIPNNKQGLPAGFANLEFAHDKDALDFYNAVEKHGLELGNPSRKVRALLVDKPQEDTSQYAQPSDTVYLNNLPKDTTIEHVRDGLGRFADMIVRVTFASSSRGPGAN